MEKQKLPNEQTIMILGLLSFLGCCCTNGVLGLILSGVGYHLATKDEKLLMENPDVYAPGSLNTWKIVNLVSLIISAFFVVYLIYLLATGKFTESQAEAVKIIESFKNAK